MGMKFKLVNYCSIISIILAYLACLSNAQLSSKHYASSCPNLEKIVRKTMKQAVQKEQRMGASILRLFFHDCFVNGCDASLLLDDTSTFTGEKTAISNRNNSVRGFEVIDSIKTNVEASCKATVSCADILALAARDGVFLLGGPSWKVPLGRRDARTASLTAATNNLPPASSSLSNLTTLFNNKGLSPKDMTALSGAHTIGLARCVSFRRHIYNDTDIDANFAATRKVNCPLSNNTGNTNLAPLDLQSPTKFDNSYYKNLIAKRGLLHSDQELYNGGSQDALVTRYSKSNAAFAKDFVAAIIKMGNISPLTGSSGEIRKNCRFIN
ncbi:peroxidase P7 [Spinacia oleracea]|uniref:Peroxidase n=1 Tax=Spinacia oleracea TaxID=3562 RepID=A0A9R0I7W4_SPIOL|nr:peroxidase P7 [Spinacia oleracea]